ncbi:hypothetical protein [Bosea vaviloviae]|uniref:Glycerophosphoryl diester phosphodiesterase membrane domain-containing protein n=1 Tax=Bosea vaviloviae TaxID=1526658 RepID=A0A1D7U2A4_9HYPH|nr:hypothetical protein [Bosea vaviloviae]AOO81494.1 hypothetical protein BHK69_14440 [Bosea vaviloviae]
MSNVFVSEQSVSGAPFRVGAVLDKTFTVFTRQFGKFILLALIPMAPLLLLGLLMGAGSGAGVGLAVAAGVTAIATLVLQVMAQATSLYGAFQEMRGQPFTIGQSLQIGLAQTIPVIGVSLLSGLAAGLGIMLFVIPGVIVMCMLSAAIPACVIEKTGVMASLRRSMALTKGYRWQVFGLLMLSFVIAFIGGFVLARIASGGLVGELLSFAWQVIATAFGAVLAAVIYHDLRAAKEGIDLDKLANIFD